MAYQLVATFLQMVRERTGEQLDAWLEEVKASRLEAFASFVTSVQQDKDAVLAGLTLPWSTGPLDGHVNRLELIKREPGMAVRSSICSDCGYCTILKREKWLKLGNLFSLHAPSSLGYSHLCATDQE
jgi:hypothetical protein